MSQKSISKSIKKIYQSFVVDELLYKCPMRISLIFFLFH